MRLHVERQLRKLSRGRRDGELAELLLTAPQRHLDRLVDRLVPGIVGLTAGANDDARWLGGIEANGERLAASANRATAVDEQAVRRLFLDERPARRRVSP